MAENRWSDLDTPLIITIGLIGAIVLFGVAVPGLKALAITLEQRYQADQVGGQASPDLQAHRYEQRQRILTNTPRWIDKESDVVAVSIDRAMELYVRRAAADRSTADPMTAQAPPAADPDPDAAADAADRPTRAQ